MSITREKLTTKEKAAVLMITMGKEKAAKVFKYLTEEEVEQLTLSITSMRRVEPELKESVIDEFMQMCIAKKYISEGGIDLAREILNNAFGEERTNDLIGKLSSSLRVKPFDFIRKADSTQVLNFIQNEHPQTIALILSYVDPRHSAQILSALPLEKQTSVIARIANMGITSPEYIKETERVLEKKLSTLSFADQTMTGGIDSLVNILNSVDRGTERHLLEALEETDAELVEEIRKRMFIFEDIVKLGNQAIQRVLKEIDNRDLAVALKGATSEVTKVIFDNISKRLQEMIQEDIEYMGPVRVRDVEEAQQKIVNVIRQLDDAGEIIISRNSGMSSLYKIDKTLVDKMNRNKDCIVITHKETVRNKVPHRQVMLPDDEEALPPEMIEQAKEYMGKANEKAQQIIDDACAQTVKIREEARQAGFGEGLAEAAKKYEAQMDMHNKQAAGALEKLKSYRQSLFDALENHLLELSLDMAEKIISIQMQNDDTVYKELVKKAVDSLKIADNFTLIVGRDEYERFFKESPDWLRAEAGCGTYEVAVDHKLPSGACVVESDDQRVDASVETQLQKIRQHLEQAG